MTAIHRSAIVPYSAHQMFDLVADIAKLEQLCPPRFTAFDVGLRAVLDSRSIAES